MSANACAARSYVLRENEFVEVGPHGVEDGSGLTVGTVIQDLGEIAESVETRDQSAQPTRPSDRLVEPRGSEHKDVPHASRLQRLGDRFFAYSSDTCVRHEHVDIASTCRNQPFRLVELVSKVAQTDSASRLGRVFALSDELAFKESAWGGSP